MSEGTSVLGPYRPVYGSIHLGRSLAVCGPEGHSNIGILGVAYLDVAGVDFSADHF